MRALSVRQPYAELILRGIKTVEYRSRATKVIGERFHIYAAGKWPARSAVTAKPWSLDLAMPSDGIPPWMVELANGLRLFPHDLPTGVMVGSAVIERVDQRYDGMWQWHLADVQRYKRYWKPTRHPQPTWFRPTD
jgi:hypothetical protein